MRILIVEDDFASRKFMMNFMSAYGDCDGTVDGMEAVEAYMMALEDKQPYDLICLDVMMPVHGWISGLKYHPEYGKTAWYRRRWPCKDYYDDGIK